MRALTAILPPGAVPAILFEDQEHHLFAMQAAQPDAKPWKSLLLDGEIVPETARRIGQLHGIWLRAGATKPGWCEEFGDLAVFEDLRVDPYYRSTAARHPDLEPCFALLVRECLKPGISLVHGDLSPKNILVTGGELVLIDFEVVHWGDPAFDMAFLINHFLLKAFYRPRWAPDLIRLAFVYRDALFQAAGTEYSWVESAAMRHLGGLLLARIDGKSPAEYIQDRPLKETIRAAARGLLLEPAATVEAAMGRCFT